MNRKRLNLVFASISLFLGIALIGVTIGKGGLGLTVGVLLGTIMLINAMLRFWAAGKG